MAEFFELSVDERLEALAQAADASGRPPHLLEKDVWVVWSLRHLFAAPYAGVELLQATYRNKIVCELIVNDLVI